MSSRTRSAAVIIACAGLTLGFASPVLLAQPAAVPAPAGAAPATAGTISDAIAGFSSGDRDKVVAARQALIAPLSGSSKNAAFLGTYAKDVATAIMPIVSGNDPHAKLNTAIAIGRIADASGSVALSPVIAKLIEDDSPAVSSFGLRAAGNVLPRVLADRALVSSDPLPGAVSDALAKHPNNEAVVNDAYSALTRILLLPDRVAAEALGPTGVTAATPRVVDSLLALIAKRLPSFGSGAVAEPGAEGSAVAFLARANTWTAMSDAQHAQTLKLMLGLLRGASSEMGAVKDPQSAGRPRMEALRGLVRNTSQGLGVIATFAGKPELKSVSDQAQALSLASPAADYQKVIGDIETAFGAAFPDAAPATKPATTP